MKQTMTDRERQAYEAVRKLFFLRLAVVVGCLAVIVLSRGQEGAFEVENIPAYLLLTLVVLVNLAYLQIADRIRKIRTFAALQIYLDVAFASLLIYLTGAGASNITFLYFACILAASIILGLRPGVLTASVATVILAGMKTLTFLAGHYGWVLPWCYSPTGEMPLTGISASVAFLLAQAISYYLVAVLAGRLAHGLRGAKLLNEKILESISDGLVAVDNDRQLRSINGEAIRLLGLPPGMPMVGRSVLEVSAFSKNADVMQALFTGEQPGMCQLSLTTLDGQQTPVAVTSSVLREYRGVPVGLLVMLIDLTERKRLEEAVARAETMEMVGQLAASIAHEIRNPLACIRGSAQEIRSDMTVEDQNVKLLDMVVHESDRINTIVTDFLHFSKMRSTALKRCNLTDALADVVTMLESRHRGKRLDIEFDATEPVFCLGDVEQLRQVFLNLGLNALDAMPEGGRLKVVVRRDVASRCRDASEGERPTTVVEFIDEGRGMSSEVKSQLFNPFFTTKPRGTGLGLSIVRRIVEAHKGSIEVESTEGEGSTFRVVLEGYPVPELQVSYV